MGIIKFLVISSITLLVLVACQNTTEDKSTNEQPNKELGTHVNLTESQEALSTKETAPRITGNELDLAVTEETIFILDVREPDEINRLGTVDGYTNIPIDQLEERLNELPRNRPILTA